MSALHGGSVAKSKHNLADDWSACWWQRRTHTLSPPPPRTVKQQQACSIGQSFMVAPLQRQTHLHRCLVGVPAAETSTHFESALTSHCGAAEESLLDQSELAWRLRCKGKQHLQVPGRRGGRQACTLNPPLLTVCIKQPQACSMLQNFMCGRHSQELLCRQRLPPSSLCRSLD